MTGERSHLPSALATYFFSSFLSSSATGFMVALGSGCPSGRPRCDMSTTDLAFLSNAYLMVSKAATILWLLLILPSFSGTLKSTLRNDMITTRSVLVRSWPVRTANGQKRPGRKRADKGQDQASVSWLFLKQAAHMMNSHPISPDNERYRTLFVDIFFFVNPSYIVYQGKCM